MKRNEVLVVGAGVAGAATALFLHRAGYRAIVFEGRSRHDPAGGALGLAPNGMAVLAQLGLAATIAEDASVIDRFVFQTANGRALGTMAFGPRGKYSEPAVSLSRRKLVGALQSALDEAGIPVFYGKRLIGAAEQSDGVTLQFADGSSATGDLAIGADGIHSVVRHQCLGRTLSPNFTGLIASGGFVPRERMLAIIGAERARDMALCFGGGAFIGYAMADKEESTGAYWWYALPRDAPLSANDRQSFGGCAGADRILAEADWCPQVRAIVGSTTQMMPLLDIFDLDDLSTWHSKRCIVIGDAAHAVSPHSGQGASLALEGAIELVDALGESSDVEVAFQNFEARRRDRTRAVVKMGRRSGNQKRLGPIGAKLQEWIMPLMLRLVPGNDWIYGWTPPEPHWLHE